MTLDEFLADWRSSDDRLLVHTSGSTGKPKPMWVEKARMRASARITCDFLQLKKGDTTLLCLPLDYIAGKMVVVRAEERGLQLFSVNPCSHPLKHWTGNAPVFAAMVPLQVASSMESEAEHAVLREIKHLIIGGGAVDESLARQLEGFPNAVWSTYGMTETLSHIALRRLNGPNRSDWYVPFEGVTVRTNAEGCLVIDAPVVAEKTLTTNDIAVIRDDGAFRIVGRKDNVVCSGGVKIQMEEVEKALAKVLSAPFMLTWCTDTRLGQALVLMTEATDVDHIMTVCEAILVRFHRPRHIVSVAQLPLTETGKPARAVAHKMAERVINKTAEGRMAN